MRDANDIVVGGQPDAGMSDEERAHEQEADDRERLALIDAWKAMYRRKGIAPDTYRIDWDTLFEGECGEYDCVWIRGE